MEKDYQQVHFNDVDFNDSPALCYFTIANPRYLALNLIKFGVVAIENMSIVKDYELYQRVMIQQCTIEETKSVIAEYIYDIIKLTTAYENFMKAKLLINNYLVHTISTDKRFKDLKKKQYDQPISVPELTSIEKFYSDRSRMMYVSNGIINKTLTLSSMLKKGYQEVIKMPDEIVEYIAEYNAYRNHLHFYYVGKLEIGEGPINKLLAVRNYAKDVMYPFHLNLLEEHEAGVIASS